jgi:hypothetical protein
MIVLSAITVGIASAVGVAAPGAQAAKKKLANISVINSLWFMILSSSVKVLDPIIPFSRKTPPVPGGVLYYPNG